MYPWKEHPGIYSIERVKKATGGIDKKLKGKFRDVIAWLMLFLHVDAFLPYKDRQVVEQSEGKCLLCQHTQAYLLT